MFDMQMNLFESEDALSQDDFVAFLNAGARRPVNVVFTQNQVSMVSVKFPHEGPTSVRLHKAFLGAPLEVRLSVRQYLRTRRKDAWALVRKFAANVPESYDGGQMPCGAKAVSALATRGRVYDLKPIFNDVNDSFFSGRVRCRIGWGRDRASGLKGRRSKSIRYGSWNPRSGTIRVHPRLDDVRVPVEFVRYIVFHEMLHTVVPADIRNGRRMDHPPAFRKLEKQFPEIARMHSLSQQLLDVLV